MFIILVIFLFFSLFFMDILYMWLLLELFFFIVMCIFVFKNKKKINMTGIIYYLFVQALSGLILLFSFLSEFCLYSNLYLLNSAISVINYCFFLLSILIKLGFYPFYLQIIKIMSFLDYKQCFFFLVFPKMIPLLLMFDLIQQEYMVIPFIIIIFLIFMVSSIQSIISIDFREIIGWSSMSQMSWMFLSLFSNIFILIVYFFFYSVLLWHLIKYINSISVKFFLSFSSISNSSIKELFVFVLLLMMSSMAPFFFFYMKLLIVSSFFFYKFFISIFMIIFMSISILFFYLRMLQFFISIGYYSSFFSCETYHNFMNIIYIILFFSFSSIFLLII